MSDVNANAVIHAEQQAEVKTPTKNQGTLKTESAEHTFFAFAETESVSEGVSQFLNEINEQADLPEMLHAFTEITEETIEIETEIQQLFEELEKTQTTDQEAFPKQVEANLKAHAHKKGETHFLNHSQAQKGENTKAEQPERVVYSSLFSLAHSFNKGLTESRKQQQASHQQQKPTDTRASQHAVFSTPQTSRNELFHQKTPQDKQDEEEGSGGGKRDQDQQQQQQKQKKRRDVFKVKASRKVSRTQAAKESNGSTTEPVGSMQNIYIRFMALMARILGQAEAEAHDLYMRIKERTDNIDLLTVLVSKINSEKGEIDWSNNDEMKQLLEKARALGVDIPEGKYQWSEEEKKLLKENVQMRKDSMEKVTQLERTDMQRYLQEASQCHQARSNVLKLLKEVMDTIIHNMRP